jgi:uncharacterized membrane protein YgaE (UPF0421/DUF939 family)
MSKERIRENRRELGYFQQQMEQLYERLPWSHRLIVGLSMAAQAVVAGGMGYGLGLLLHTQQAFWGALTAIAVTQTTYVDTRKSSNDQVLGAIVGAAVALIGASLAQDSYPVYAITMAVAIVLCWSFNIGTAGKLSATTVTIVMLVPHQGAYWTVALTRLGEVTIGIFCALIVTRIAHWLEARLIGDPHVEA